MRKTIGKDQWDVKFLRESAFMPFGSMCNLIGQALSETGKGITEEQLEVLARKAFSLALEFVNQSYESVERASEEEAEIKIKK